MSDEVQNIPTEGSEDASAANAQSPNASVQDAPDELEVMRQQMSRMEDQLKEANTRLSDSSYIEYLANRAMGSAPAQSPTAGAGPETSPIPEDFDSIKPTEFLNVVKQVVAQQVLPQVGQVANAVSRLESRMEIERVAAKYEDFDSYVPAMQKIVESNPYILPEQAYLLAKSSAPAQSEKAASPAPPVSIAKKIADELRGSGAVPGGATPNAHTMAGKPPEQVASTLYDKIFGGRK